MAASIKITTSVNAPVNRTWEILSNPVYLEQWVSGFIAIEHLQGNAGNVGSTSKLKFAERGKEIEVVEKILEVVPHKQFTIQITGDEFESISDIRLISLGRKTELIQAVQLTPKHILMKIMMPVIKGEFKRRMTEDLGRLKNLVEKKDDWGAAKN